MRFEKQYVKFHEYMKDFSNAFNYKYSAYDFNFGDMHIQSHSILRASATSMQRIVAETFEQFTQKMWGVTVRWSSDIPTEAIVDCVVKAYNLGDSCEDSQLVDPL